MPEMWLDLSNIPEQGLEYIFQEQMLWSAPILEFALPCRIISPLHSLVFLLPQKKGCFIQGSIQGVVSMPCCRCAEPGEISLDNRFEILESLERDQESDPLGPDFLRRRAGLLELDIGGILWEQFVLSLPVKHLCQEDCRGICVGCAQNLNHAKCRCSVNQSDPRLEIFRNLKINKV